MTSLEHDPERCIPLSSPTCQYHVHMDKNIFDGLQNTVFECMQSPYYKFFESQYFIDHVNVSRSILNESIIDYLFLYFFVRPWEQQI